MFGTIIFGDNMKINNIKKQANGQYNITFDNNEKILTYDDVILNNNLLYKNEINYDVLKKIMKETSYYDVYNKAINYIANRIRSKQEIETFINKFNLTKGESDTIINNLTKIGFINDQLFAKAYLNDKLKFTNMGPNKIANDLENLGVGASDIQLALDELDYSLVTDKLHKIINKKINKNIKYSKSLLKQKTLLELNNNGFNSDDIVSTYDELCKNTNDILANQYEKVYATLSKKYSDFELNNKIKQKLAQKGFSFQEIIDYIATKNNT